MIPNRTAETKSLLLILTRPASLRLCRDPRFAFDSNEVRIDGCVVLPGYPDDLSFPDILYDEPSRTLVGLTFDSSHWENVLNLFRHLDDRVVEFRTQHEAPLRAPRLDIRWAPSKHLVVEAAQLADVWFYFRPGLAGQRTALVAVELDHIEEILSVYKLQFPRQFRLEPHEVTFR
jgi:hypothetical protein